MGGGGDKKRKRALDDLRRGLSRRDGELACAGLLALEPADRDPYLAEVASLLAAGAMQARGCGAWPRLVQWAKRIESEPRLLIAHDGAAADELRWALAWGCALSGEWTRAERFWSELAPAAASFNAPLADVVTSWIATKGHLSSLPPLLLRFAPSELDPRLGIEPIGVRRNADPPPPAGAQDAERAVVEARAVLGSNGFEPWVIRALGGADTETAAAVGEVAAALALRDALGRVEARRRDAMDPLSLVAACADRKLAAPSQLLLALRLALGRLRAAPLDRRSASVLSSLVRAGMRDESLAPLVRETLVALAADAERGVDPSAIDGAMTALGAAAESVPGAAIWAAGVALAARHLRYGQKRLVASGSWLELGAETMVGDGRDLAVWLGAANARSRAAVFDFLARRAPAAAAQRAIVAVARLQDDRLRPALAECIDELLSRLSSRYCPDCQVVHEIRGDYEWADLSNAAQEVWIRIEDDVLAVDAACLRVALGRAQGSAPRRRVLDRYVARARSAADWVEAIVAARALRLRKAPRALVDGLIARYGADSSELASAFELARRTSGAMVVVPLARALLKAIEASPTSPPPHAAAAAERASQLIARVDRRAAAASRRHRGGSGGRRGEDPNDAHSLPLPGLHHAAR